MNQIPENLGEALIELAQLADGDKDFQCTIKSTEGGFTANAHSGIGRWLRNNWGLWAGQGKLYDWFIEQGIGHADDMSGIILTTFYRRYKKRPEMLEDQILFYKKFWLNQGIDPLTLKKVFKRN